MEVIDNITRLLGDDLKRSLVPGAKLKIAASCFSIYAYEALKAELEQIESLEFIFTSPTFVQGQATDKLPKERREFFIPKLERERSLYGTEFEIQLRNKLRLNYDVLNHTDLQRTSGYSHGTPLKQINWGNYDLVVIDESHNFRNHTPGEEERESRYERLMNQVIRAGVKTKVLMLSATPVNNRFSDLRNQLALAYEGESENLRSKLKTRNSVEEIFRQAQAAFTRWSKLPAEERTPEAILKALDFEFFELLDSVTIARSRKHIEAHYDTAEIGTFPERRLPLSFRPPLTDRTDVHKFDAIYEQLTLLDLAVYTPAEYILASRRSKYEESFRDDLEGISRNVSLAGQQQGIRALMTVNLLKRLESSVQAFRLTLRRLASTNESMLVQIANHESGKAIKRTVSSALVGEPPSARATTSRM